MYVRQALDITEGLISKVEDSKDISAAHLQKLIVFAIMWSLGALLELDDRKKVCSTNWTAFLMRLSVLCRFGSSIRGIS